MSEQFNLFDLLGVKVEEVGEKRKKANNNKKKEKKANNNKKVSHETYKLPLTIYTGMYDPIVVSSEDVKDADTLTIEAIKNYFCTLHKQFKPEILQVVVKQDIAYVGLAKYKYINKGTVTLNGTDVYMGNEKVDLSSVMTDEECTVDIEEISTCVHEQYPFIDQVSILVGDGCTLLLPANNSPMPKTFPINVYFIGREMYSITEEDYKGFLLETDAIEEDCEEDLVIEENVIRDMLKKEYPDLSEFVELQYSHNGSVVVLLNVVEKKSIADTKTSEKMYPTKDVVISLIWVRIPLSPDDFNGKEKITESELLAFLSARYPEYTKERTSFMYSKEEKLIIPVLKGSTKGCGISVVTDKEEYTKRIQSGEYQLFNYKVDDMVYRVESTPASLTVASDYQGSESYYELRLPKIPGKVYDLMVALFDKVAEVYSTEFLVTLYYDMDKSKYKIVIPRQCNTGSVVNAYYDLDIIRGGAYPVADFHSHCHYNAFFSNTDDADELGNKIFGVFGSFGSDTITEVYRAGTGGKYVEISKEDIFTYETATEEEKETFVENTLSRFELHKGTSFTL